MRKFCSASGEGARGNSSFGYGTAHGSVYGNGRGDGLGYSYSYQFYGTGGGCYPYQLIQYWS